MEQPLGRIAGLSLMALCLALAAPLSASAAVTAPTPKMADGHPDLNGVWTAGPAFNFGGGPPPTGDVTINLPVRNGIFDNLTNDNNMAARVEDNLPKYKPEFWDKVQDLDLHGNK